MWHPSGYFHFRLEPFKVKTSPSLVLSEGIWFQGCSGKTMKVEG